MFSDLVDAVSVLGSWRWPVVTGEVTAVEVDSIPDGEGGHVLRLAVAYKFSIATDGPYTGQSFWDAAPGADAIVIKKSRMVHIGQPVVIRYRAHDPSINRLDRSVWRGL